METDPDNEYEEDKIDLSSIVKDFTEDENYSNKYLELFSNYINKKQQKIGTEVAVKTRRR